MDCDFCITFSVCTVNAKTKLIRAERIIAKFLLLLFMTHTGRFNVVLTFVSSFASFAGTECDHIFLTPSVPQGSWVILKTHGRISPFKQNTRLRKLQFVMATNVCFVIGCPQI